MAAAEAKNHDFSSGSLEHADALGHGGIMEIVDKVGNAQRGPPGNELVGALPHDHCRDGCDDDPGIKQRALGT